MVMMNNIALAASLAMMEYLVGIDSRDYRYRRRELNLSDTVDVQPMFISEDQTLQVYQSWRDHADEPDELKRYYIIGLETGIPLSQIWTHIMVAIDSVGTKISNQSGGG